MAFEQGELILYKSEDGQAAVDVRLKDETVWLSQAQIQELFGRERSVLTKHINNVFKEGELDKNQVCAKFAHTAADGKTYQVVHYNLDVIISVGYRVKAQRGTQFRIWATSVLKDHLVKGYTLNQKRLAEKGIDNLLQQKYIGRPNARHPEHYNLYCPVRMMLQDKSLSGRKELFYQCG